MPSTKANRAELSEKAYAVTLILVSVYVFASLPILDIQIVISNSVLLIPIGP